MRRLIHHFFVPHEGNNFRAKSLNIDFLAFYLVIVFFLAFFSQRIPAVSNILGVATDITSERLFELTNSERAKNNLSTLTYNEKLSQAAHKKAQDMLDKNYWSHYSPDGTTPWQFIIDSGYAYEYAGENLAKNFLYSDAVVDGWMDSTTHKENILRKEYSDVGYAVVNGVLNGEETTLVVQMFGNSSGEALAQKDTETKPVESSETVAGQQTAKRTLTLSSFTPRLNAAYLFLLFLVVALLSDLYFAARLNVFRIVGKNLAHLIFLGFVFVGLFMFITKGSIQ